MKTPAVAAFIVCLGFLTANAYSRVSRNGQARSAAAQDIEFTVSPIHVVTPANLADLRPGEAIDHAQSISYEARGGSRYQERFVPSASFPSRGPGKLVSAGAVTSDDAVFAKPQMISMTYDYPPNGYSTLGNSVKPQKTMMMMMMPKPTTESSLPVYPTLKIPTYSSGPLESSPPQMPKPPKYIDYDRPPKTIEYDRPPKVIEFPGHYDSPFDPHPHHHHHHDEDEIIYDHIPDDFFHHHHHHHTLKTTTEEPMDQRLDKRPYSYYYIGRKLWYVPLYFSIYFIIYIALLVLRSIARHKINFPTALAAAAASNSMNGGAARQAQEPGWMDYLGTVLDSIEMFADLNNRFRHAYMRDSRHS